MEVQNQAFKALPGLSADERKLKQIFLILLSNAVKFTPAGHSVGVGTTVTVCFPAERMRERAA